MMKKFKYVMLMAAALMVGFTSCSNDDVTGGENPVNGEKTMARITLTQSAVGTYAPANSEVPTTAEKEVKTAMLYIFNASQVLEETVPLTVNAGAAESKVFELTTGTHYFYASVNAPAAVPAIAKGTALATVEKTLIDVAAIADLTDPANGFFMTNVSKPLGVNIVQSSEADAQAGLKNDVKIQVGRAVTKVNVEFAPLTQTGGVLSNAEYKVKNNPIKMFFMPVFNAGKLETPFFNDATVTLTNYFHNSTLIAADGQPASASYAMENSNENPKKGNATYVMVKGTFTPEKTYDKDGGNENAAPTTGDTFWRIERADGTYMDKLYFENPSGGTEMTAAGAGAQILEYTNGESFYGLWLADNSITGDKVAKHTVKRNSYYYVVVTSVSGPGANTEEGVVTDPEEQIDAETFIKASIEILDWTVIDQSGGI